MSHILIIEDSDGDFAALQRSILRSMPGTTIQRDVYGEGEIDKLIKGEINPDLIISDQNLPQTTGVELCTLIREAEITVPFIIMTGGGSEEIAVEALKKGANDYVVKDVSGSWARLLAEIIPATLQSYEDKIIRQQVEKKLKATAKELKSRNEELNAFARTLAHDLKSPVAQMIGFAELLKEASPELLETKKDKWIDSILRIGRTSADTIQSLLDLTQYNDESNQFSPLDMWFTFETVVFKLNFEAEKNHKSIVFPNEWPWIIGHPEWIKEIWVNLLRYAVQHGEESQKIQIDWEATEHDKIIFTIKSQGRQFSPPELKSFFDLATTIPERKSNINLGLSLTKQIVEKQGGNIGAYLSEDENLVLWFTLPAATNL